jgi:hypothetical protein
VGAPRARRNSTADPTVESVFTLDFLAKGENVNFVAPHGLGTTIWSAA